MSPHGLDDGAVVEEDEHHRQEIVEAEGKDNVTPVVEVVAQVVVAASHKHALDGIAATDS